VTYFMYTHPDAFRVEQVVDPLDRSWLRWTVDTPEDLALAREIYAALGPSFAYADAVALFEARPELARINAHVEQRS
jgi:spore coat polysaccharide biosynthesis protein SpsF